MTETIRLEEYTGILSDNSIALVWTLDGSAWLPTEFMLSQYITRILVVGRVSESSITFALDPTWTQVWRAPGAKEWSCLLGILPHMPGPVLVVIGPDVSLSHQILTGLRSVSSTTIVLRSPPASAVTDGWNQSALGTPSHMFFPVIGTGHSHGHAMLQAVIHEWNPRLDLKALLPQLAMSNYGLVFSAGVWQWYKPNDSPPLIVLSPALVGKQIQLLGAIVAEQKK